eukprot:6279774-Prymnesium_polylepis.1
MPLKSERYRGVTSVALQRSQYVRLVVFAPLAHISVYQSGASHRLLGSHGRVLEAKEPETDVGPPQTRIDSSYAWSSLSIMWMSTPASVRLFDGPAAAKRALRRRATASAVS